MSSAGHPRHASVAIVIAIALGACAIAACGGSDGAAPAAAQPTRRAPAAATCALPGGHSGRPETIEEAIALIDALPKPVTIACFLQVLDRPFHIDVSSGGFSLQPAFGQANPRIFVQSGALVLSVVPAGKGSTVVELGVKRSSGRSLKAELQFPVSGDLSPGAGYERIVQGSGTKCAVCHKGESQDLSITHATAYASELIPPADENGIEPSYLEWAYQHCDAALEPERCAIFDAVFGPNDVVYQRLTK